MIRILKAVNNAPCDLSLMAYFAKGNTVHAKSEYSPTKN